MIPGHNLFIQVALKYGFSLFGIPKTGQTTSYRTGDDGDHERGYPKAGARFVDNGDGTISDMATGLMWVKDPIAAGLGGPIDWYDAVDACEALNYAGYTDWRMPNLKELQSIVDYGKNNPAIDEDFFVCVAGAHWSSTTDITNSGQAWGYNFLSGITTNTSKSATPRTRPVRLGV